MQNHRALTQASFNRLAFEYDPEIDYSSHALIIIGNMDKECQHCHAFKYKGESAGLCCASGKVSLPPLNPPPEPLKTLLAGATSQSKLFLRKIRGFNSCFQMTSFEVTKIIHDEDGRDFESTFKIQGQVYHKISSLLSMSDADPKFLQIYFMGDEEQQANTRCICNHIEQMEEREIVELLENVLQNHNKLLQLFKTLSNRLQNDNYAIIIKADKVPYGEHADTYNVPTINEVAVVMTGDLTEGRDICVQRRDNTVQTIQDNHRSYDVLQYPLIFWEGEYGFHLNIKQRNSTTGEELNKKVSAMNFYAYRLMIRSNEDNNIFRCRQLFHQYIVDMYAKIESERLRYIKFNQAKLRSEEYIHLRDAIIGNVDATNDINNIGMAYILPSSYSGSPRHMHEYCYEFCLVAKVRPEEIDKIISAEIPDPNVDQELFAIVTTNMIHGLCGTLNMMSPCMDKGKCTKRFPKPCQTDTITNIDGYPSYRRRDVNNGGQSY
ncbi:helitron_like_N domain-containing protein [Trichonephila clavipes]|nr:helitron_like_N domain-containing protein [Trichonephila clavipes]